MAYATRKATKLEEGRMRQSIPSPLGHTITGFDIEFRPKVETCYESSIRNDTDVEYVRIKMPNGKYMYRTITSR